MPELPEVHTTATMLNEFVKGLKITDVWTDYSSNYHKGRKNIKDPAYFKDFKNKVIGKKILSVSRRAKNVLVDIESEMTILVHMKMTGQLLYGEYSFNSKENTWKPTDPTSPLAGSFSRFVHLVFCLSNGKHIAFSDMRKFATVSLIPDTKARELIFSKLGPEPLEENFTWKELKERINKKPKGKIKTVLMDPLVVAGIGNIYSDEILWASFIHPERLVASLSDSEIKLIMKQTKEILSKGIELGGDSMSDYRNPLGEKGNFQNHHNVYQKKNKPCPHKGCAGTIVRKMIGQRSAHFCDRCQK